MNANRPRHTLLCLCTCLSLACMAHLAPAQRRAGARPAQRKPAQPSQPTQKGPPAAAQATSQTGQHVTIRWAGQPGIERYRLQVARDRGFGDIVFDRAVVGLEAQVDLPPGDNFFWRVAPAAQETGEYSTPEPVALNAGAGVSGSGLLRTPTDIGWQAFTGEVLRPQTAPLRGTGTTDVIAVNNEGTVFALDGANGSALWTARYRPNARRDETPAARPASVFTPVVIHPTEAEKANVVVAFDGGVRALEGETGRELWRLSLPGMALSGACADLDNDKVAAELAVVTAEPALHFIDARSGRKLGAQKLDGALVGGPVPFITDAARGMAVALAGGMMDVRRLDGTRYHAIKFDVSFTTAPMILAGPNGTLIVIGTEHGLLFLDGDMKPLGKITTPDDSPRGRLDGADLNHDGVLEIVALMKSGKVVLVNSQGHITWSADGAGDAYSPMFADLNGDGVLDVLAASDRSFAVGFDGRDGTLLWQVDEMKAPNAAPSNSATQALRSLALVGVGANRPLIVSGDPTRAGVRAVGLPTAPLKVAAP